MLKNKMFNLLPKASLSSPSKELQLTSTRKKKTLKLLLKANFLIGSLRLLIKAKNLKLKKNALRLKRFKAIYYKKLSPLFL